MDKELKKKYEKLARQHAEFLCEEVFTPAFVMGFIHGAKHAFQDRGEKKKKRRR